MKIGSVVAKIDIKPSIKNIILFIFLMMLKKKLKKHFGRMFLHKYVSDCDEKKLRPFFCTKIKIKNVL